MAPPAKKLKCRAGGGISQRDVKKAAAAMTDRADALVLQDIIGYLEDDPSLAHQVGALAVTVV